MSARRSSATHHPPATDPPWGSVVFAVGLEVPTSGSALCALATDFDRYEQAEPRLRSGRWLDPSAPREGAQAEIVGEIPFTVPAVRRVIGHPRGIATLEQFAPPERLAYTLSTPRAHGCLIASFNDTADGCFVDVRGWIVPRHRLGQLALAPLAAVLGPLANQAVRRGLLRAATALGD